MTRTSTLGPLALLALVASCGGGDVAPPPPPPPSQAGDLIVSYFQAGPAAGAMLITVSGGPVLDVSVRGSLPLQVSSASPVTGTTHIVVTGLLTTGDLLTLHVPDVTQVANYSVHIDQLADNVTFSLIDATIPSLTVHR